MRPISISVIVFLLLATNSFATAYYVSSTGNDANPGTSIATAWASITKVNGQVFLPGDALYFEGGQTFNGNIKLTSSDANDPANIFVISSYGTGKATINGGTSYGFYAYNTQGFSVSNLIMDGNAASTNTAAGITVFSDLTGDVKLSNISFDHIEVKNFGAEGVVIYTSEGLTGFQNVTLSNLSVHDVTKNGIKTYGFLSQTLVGWQHKNVMVTNCEVYNVPGSGLASLEGDGIVLEGVDGGVIQYCVAHDNGQKNPYCGGPGGIWTLESNNIIIQFCESYLNHNGTGCDGLGFDLDGGVTNSIMQYNYSHDNDGSGYLLGQFPNARPWSNNTMRYNIGENNGVTNGAAIGLFKGPGTTMSGANIYNNTVYVSPQVANTALAAVNFTTWTTGINEIAFYNNIFITTGNVPLVNIPVGYSAFFAGNIYWPSGGTFSISYQGTNYSSLDAWRTATSNELVSGANTGFNSDPLLTNVGHGGTIGFGNSLTTLNAYKISDISSPAYNAALDLNALYSINPGNIDFWGSTLPGGNLNGIGASQFSSTLPLELLSFYGNCTGTENEIFWATAKEINLKSIDLMSSSDGIHFSKLTEINPKGSNSSYDYVNDQHYDGNNYYQLKMTDFDGAVTRSPVLNISCGTLSNKVNVWPNPFSQSVYISIESAISEPANLSIYDALGKLLSQRKVQIREGDNQFSLDGMNNLPAGAYYLQVMNQHSTDHFKLLKTGN